MTYKFVGVRVELRAELNLLLYTAADTLRLPTLLAFLDVQALMVGFSHSCQSLEIFQ